MMYNTMNVTSGFFFSNVLIACDLSMALQALGVLNPSVLLKLIFLRVLIEKVHDVVRIIAKVTYKTILSFS